MSVNSTILLNKPVEPDRTKLASYLKFVNENAWYTNFGPLHKELTDRLEEFLGVKNLLLVSNGTLALQVAAKVLNVNNTLTTPFSFIATTSAMLWQNQEIKFGDIDINSYNLSPDEAMFAIKKDKSIDSILATHVYGNPCDVLAFENIRLENDVKLIYDAAHAFGVNIDGQSILNYGDASTLSFHATKVFHTVEGGAIVFKSSDYFEKAKALINFGITSNGNIIGAGINAKLNEYQCAVGLTLLDQADMIINHRATMFELYRQELFGVVAYPKWHFKASHNGAYMPILVPEYLLSRVMNELTKNGIQYRQYFTPSLDQAFPELHSFGCLNSNQISGQVICLPLHYYLTQEDVLRVCNVIKGAM